MIQIINSHNLKRNDVVIKSILRAMKRYGIILADNGSPWYISGAPNDGWDDDDLHELQNVLGSNFEAVDTSYLLISSNSGKAKQICASCGNGVCNATAGETLTTCFKDCCRKKGTSCVVSGDCYLRGEKCRASSETNSWIRRPLFLILYFPILQRMPMLRQRSSRRRSR